MERTHDEMHCNPGCFETHPELQATRVGSAILADSSLPQVADKYETSSVVPDICRACQTRAASRIRLYS